MARSPAALSPAYTSVAMITRRPCWSAGRNGRGGAGITLAIVESSFGAASAAATNEAITSGSAGRISVPPKTVSSS